MAQMSMEKILILEASLLSFFSVHINFGRTRALTLTSYSTDEKWSPKFPFRVHIDASIRHDLIQLFLTYAGFPKGFRAAVKGSADSLLNG